MLANVYLHYVLDLWVEKFVKPRARGEIYYVRFADDFVIMTQFKDEAENILTALKRRLAKFSLEVAEDKTRILRFGRFCRQKASFDFLGFTFSLGKTRNGKYRTNVTTSKKKLKTKKADVKLWLKDNMHIPMNVLLEKIASKLRGHNNFYGVSGNLRGVSGFFEYVRRCTYKVLCRRSQRKRLNTIIFDGIWNKYAPKPHIAVNIWF